MLRGDDGERERSSGGGGAEPIFMLKASSRLAPTILRAAFETAEELGHKTHPVVRAWRATHQRIVAWQQANPGKLVDP